MPLTLDEIKSLIGALGVKIPEDILVQKAKAEEFAARREKISAEASGKPGDWWLKTKFDDALKRADDSAGQKSFDAALKALDEAAQLLQQPEAPPTPEAVPAAAAQKTGAEPETGGFSLLQLQKHRLAWDGLRKNVQAQLQQLEQAILAGVRAHNADETAEDEFEEGEVGTAIKTLHGILGAHDQQLLDKLDEALNAKSDEQRRERHQEAAAIIQEYQSFVAGDPTIALIDANGFTPTTIRTEVTSTLASLAGKF